MAPPKANGLGSPARVGKPRHPHMAERPPCRGATSFAPERASATILRRPTSSQPGGICFRRIIPRPSCGTTRGGATVLC